MPSGRVVKMSVNGRPSKYKPEYDQMLIDHMASGLSFESFAGIVGVCDDTLREWEKVHPSFSASKKEAFAKNRVFWEKLAINYITHSDGKEGTPKLNSTVWIFNMKNRFPKQWRDRIEHSGSDEQPLNLTLNYERKKKSE